MTGDDLIVPRACYDDGRAVVSWSGGEVVDMNESCTYVVVF